jgi:hypothetical protein
MGRRDYAEAQNLALLTANVRDFLTLRQTWQQEGREHAGVRGMGVTCLGMELLLFLAVQAWNWALAREGNVLKIS